MRAVFLISPALIFLFFLNFNSIIFASSTNVVINEIMAKPASGNNEWVELYNPTSTAIDLTNWKIKDANTLDSDDIKLEGQIEPLGFKVFEHSSGWLNDSGGETVSLSDGSSTIIDSYQYNNASTDKTFGRVPDGESWQSNLTPTKGTANQNSNQGAASSPPPSPTPTNTPSLTPSPSPTSNPSSAFTISNVPNKINANSSITANVYLFLPNTPSTTFYLKGAFVKGDTINYFGLTLVSGSWVKNSAKYSDQKQITTDYSGLWSGDLEIKADPDDSGFIGSGNYNFKVARYTSSGTGPTWSNEVQIEIEKEDTTQSLNNPSPSPNQPKSNSQAKITALPSNTEVDSSRSNILGQSLSSTPTATTATPLNNKIKAEGFFKLNWIFITLGLIIFGSSCILILLIWKGKI